MQSYFKGNVLFIVPETKEDIEAFYVAGFRDGGDIGLLVCQVAPGTEKISHLQMGGTLRNPAKGSFVLEPIFEAIKTDADETHAMRITTAKEKKEPIVSTKDGIEALDAALEPKFVDPDAKPDPKGDPLDVPADLGPAVLVIP